MRGIALDVRDPAAIDALARRLRDEEPELNVLINNAGISHQQRLTPGETDRRNQCHERRTNHGCFPAATCRAAQKHDRHYDVRTGIRAARQFSDLLCEQGISAFLASIAARQDARVLCQSAGARTPYVQTELAGGTSAH